MPLWLTEVKHLDQDTTNWVTANLGPSAPAWLMGTLGISATIGSFAIPALSDRIGRRPVMIAAPFIAVILPLGALYHDGSLLVLGAIFFVGWVINGIFPLFMATVPSESVDPLHAATALGLAMGSGEVLGGAFGPTIAGFASDHIGRTAPLWIMVGLAIAAGIAATFLRETAPSQIAKKA
jgi:MFS family permease